MRPPATVPLLGVPDDQAVARIVLNETLQELGVQLVDSPDSLSEPGQVAGVACRIARRTPLAGPVLYFRIDPRFVRPAMEAYITVSYRDSGEGEWFIEYERRGAEPEGGFARTLPVRLRNTGEWRTVTFPITDAVSRRHCNLGDFRIHAYTPTSDALCVEAVSVGRELPEGAALVGVRPDQKAVSVSLGPAPEENGLWAIESPDSVLEPYGNDTDTGVQVLRAPKNGPVIYFRLDPRFVREREGYYVTVDYLDVGAEAWFVEYPAWDREYEPGQFEGTLSVRQTETGEWRRVTFYLPNARLTRACNLGDSRIHAFEPQARSIVLRRVQVSKERPSEPGQFVGLSGGDTVISVVLQGRNEGSGLEQFDITDEVSAPAVVAGRPCRRVSNPVGSPQAYFRMDHRFVTPNTPLAITLEFLDVGTNQLGLEYDSTDQSVDRVPVNPGAFKPAGAIQKTDTGQWRSETFYLSEGRFMHRCNGGDFRFVSDAPQEAFEYFARVTVRRLADPVRPQVAETAPKIDLLPIPEIIRPDGIRIVSAADPEVSIIIPVYNKVEYTRQCLYALGETSEGRYEVIVVDNGSTDGTGDLLSSLPGIRYFRSERNLGFARGCNLGAQAAKAPLLLFLNNDTVPQRGWLAAMLRALEQHPDVAVVGARLIYPQTLEVQHAGVAFNDEGLPYHLFHFDRWDSPRITQTRLLQAVTGACCLIKREAFEAAGGFDEGFLNGFEDIDLCLKIGQAGGRCLYCPEALLLHYESVTEGRLVWENEMANVARFRERWAYRVVRDGASLTAAHPL